MAEENPQVAPEDQMDLSQDLNTLIGQMSKVLKNMTKDGDVDPEESKLATEALFFLKCWEEASTAAGAEEVLGMSSVALQAAAMFVTTNTLSDTDFGNADKVSFGMAMFLMGIFTGIEYQERKHG